jgi:flagellar hook-associated protein 2
MADLGLSGLASGVDTSAIVEQLMSLERQGQTRLSLRQSAIGAQQTALRDLKTKLDALKSAAADLRAPATWAETQTAESSDPRVVVARTGGAPIGGYSVKVTQLASSRQETFTYVAPAAADTLTIDGKTVAIAAGTKIADVAAAINGRSDMSAYAAVVGDKLVLSSRATGAGAAFSATGGGLTAVAGSAVAGRDAEYWLDGDTEPRTSATNVVEDAIPGLRLTFKGVTAEPAGVVVAAPALDRDKVKAEVKAFVDAYNAVVSATRSKVDEKKVRDATTTTDYVKGQLFGDSGLNSMLSQLRLGVGHVYQGINGTDATLDDLTDIGISTGKAGGTIEQAKSGLLSLDADKLAAALDKDADGVRRLFGGTSTSAFAQDLEKLTGDLSKLLDGRIESAGLQSKRITDEMARTDTRLAEKEKRLKAQFAAMEAAMAASQTQMAWLQGQLAGLPTTWS